MEGGRLLGAALDAGAVVDSVYVAPGAADGAAMAPLLERALAGGSRLFELAPGVLERVADTVTPQPVLTVVRIPAADRSALDGATFVVVCVDVRDPGNAGAVIRAADAAGADVVVCCEGTADPYGPKAVRASAGSVLHLPIVRGGQPGEVLADLGRRGMRRMAAVARGGAAPPDLDLLSPLALVLGKVARGLPVSIAAQVDERVTIPMAGRAESLNVSLAAAVLCFEVRRQRDGQGR